jgi:ABC-type multidrug transport system fused ATPase/permease subunit
MFTEWRIRFRRAMNETDQEANTRAVDSLLNFETVKYFGAEAREAQRYDGAMQHYEAAAVKTGLSLSFLNGGQAFIINTGLILVMVMAAMGVQIVFNHADYRLLGRRPLEALRDYQESHLFLRGMIPQLGYRARSIEFDRAERFAGESKYPMSKMLALAWRGVTSFSAAPLRIITGLGAVVSMLSVGMGAWALAIRLFTDVALPGWASTVIPMYFLGGIQLLSLGIIGEYLAKVYEATKARPRYHVEAIAGRWSRT